MHGELAESEWQDLNLRPPWSQIKCSTKLSHIPIIKDEKAEVDWVLINPINFLQLLVRAFIETYAEVAILNYYFDYTISLTSTL